MTAEIAQCYARFNLRKAASHLQQLSPVSVQLVARQIIGFQFSFIIEIETEKRGQESKCVCKIKIQTQQVFSHVNECFQDRRLAQLIR